jgi:hypothetical protein
MIVVSHQHPSADEPVRSFADLGECVDEELVAMLIKEDFLPVVASSHDMVKGTLELNAGRSMHRNTRQ